MSKPVPKPDNFHVSKKHLIKAANEARLALKRFDLKETKQQ